MHWSGWVRVAAIFACAAVAGVLGWGMHWAWYLAFPLSVVAYFAVPIVFGIAWGMRDNREMMEDVERVKANASPYKCWTIQQPRDDEDEMASSEPPETDVR